MAGKVKRMSTIKQLVQLHLWGVSNRQIALRLNMYKATVNNYVQKIRNESLSPRELLELDDPVLEKRFHAGSPAYCDGRFDVIKNQYPDWENELKNKHVTKHLLWQEYRAKHRNGYGYSQFCYHLQQMSVARKPSAILTHFAGEKLFLDFAGDKLQYVDRETGEIILVQVFVATLPFSDYTFTMAVPDQSTDSFIYALTCCIEHLGGCPKILVPDNLKAAVIKADRYEPRINSVLEDFANHYGCVVIPTRVAHPKDKALVESSVHRIYQRVYARLRNHIFFSLEELNQALADKTRDHNQTRMQQKPYSREEKFLADEKNTLRPLSQTPFEIKYYCELKVAQNNCIYLGRDKHHYSVPFRYIGQKASVVYTRTLVKIYVKGELAATHVRNYKYGYTTLREHLCSTHQHYLDRSPEYYIKKAKERSQELYVLIETIFKTNDTPELLYKRCDGLMSLQRKTDPALYNKACQLAVDNNMLTYQFVRSLIENKIMLQQLEAPHERLKPLPRHKNIRGKKYYQ